MNRTISLSPHGFVVSNDPERLLSRFLNTNVLGDHADQLATLFAPDGEGFYIPSLGGAQRLEDRDRLRPPYDADPSLDPERMELWTIERERPFHAPLQLLLTGEELRALLVEAQRLRSEQVAHASPKTEP